MTRLFRHYLTPSIQVGCFEHDLNLVAKGVFDGSIEEVCGIHLVWRNEAGRLNNLPQPTPSLQKQLVRIMKCVNATTTECEHNHLPIQ